MLQRFIKESRRGFSSSVWGSVSQAPVDPILGVTDSFKKDTDPRKCLFGTGAYRDENG
jgi:aspartate/tyrosine/aromatic aminotransferase